MPDAGRTERRRARLSASVCVCVAVLACGCAGKQRSAQTLMPALAPAYPEFQYPTVPPALRDPRATAALDRGWQHLQRNDLPAARREFASALGNAGTFYPALAAEGYAALGSQEYAKALQSFDAALGHARDYVPALVGRGRVLLALDRPDEALVAFETAVAQDPTQDEVRSRVEVLRFRRLQTRITDARSAAAAGNTANARVAYGAAIAASPESGFLFRELAAVDRAAGDDAAAVTHLRRAIELDPGDVAALLDLGALLERQQDLAGALGAYTTAASLQPSDDLRDKTTTLTRRLREAQLPAPFQAIAAAAQITRGDLAALIGVRLDALVASVAPRPVVVTDIRGHWAAQWIGQVVDAGLMPALDNHTFEPAALVRRVDLADVAARLLRLLPPSPRITAASATSGPAIADVQPSHLNFAAIAAVVNAGVMPLLDGRRFQVTRAVAGAEAIEVVDRIQALIAAVP